jgi:hypothetical protein
LGQEADLRGDVCALDIAALILRRNCRGSINKKAANGSRLFCFRRKIISMRQVQRRRLAAWKIQGRMLPVPLVQSVPRPEA